MSISRAELKSLSKEQLRGNIGMYFVCMLIVAAGSAVANIIPVVGGLLISPPLVLGMALIGLGLTEGVSVDISTLFSGFSQFGNAVILNILIAVFTFLWSLLLIIPGIIKAISYSMSWYILAENPEMSATDALDASKKLMDGHKMDYFVLMLSFILWMLLGAITCGIAYIYVIPYIQTTSANFYKAIK